MESLYQVLAFLFISITIITSASANNHSLPENEQTTSYIGLGQGRYNSHQRLPANATCNIFPRVCHLKTSPGPDCCKKKCVNVRTDRLNCGWCGHKCKYNEICCRGNCVNPSFDRRHCGGCRKRCKRGDICAYGMCSYA